MYLIRQLQTWLLFLLIIRALVVQRVQYRELTFTELSLLPSQSSSIDRLNQTSPSPDPDISANRPAVFCDATEYGRDLVTADCRDAITGIKRNRQRVRFGERSADPGTWDVGLPSRQIGVQGLCTVQLEFKPGRSSAIATSLDVSLAAIAVLGTCVGGTGINTGGLAIDIGGDNNLGVALVPYEPHVQCIDGSIGPPGSTVPPLISCNAVVGLMFATKDVVSFGKPGSGATQIVPGVDASPDHLCVLVIDTTGPVENVSWIGKTGKATGLGENGNLFITMWSPKSPSGGSVPLGNATLLRGAATSEVSNVLWSMV
ncbi:MAG: hypothetical protein ASARMPRED_008273 [Alectoria sarmentosa]|nr:MAG: hypothetical protein ASARMPRED_008273 [Alectoria sarmentosa]